VLTRLSRGSVWREPVIDFRGKHHRVDRAGILPLPKRPIPIWFGGFVPAAFERAAHHGDGFQFGAAVGNALMEGVHLDGRYPFVRLVRGKAQLGMHTDRGMIALTLEGAKVLTEQDAFCVEIEDFQPKGNIFAVGVTDATADIRIWDEVAVRHRGEVRASGNAAMTPREMRELRRGEAVRVRHRLPAKAL